MAAGVLRPGETLSRLATRLAIPMRCTKSKATAAIYGRLSLTLVRSCARALLQELDLWTFIGHHWLTVFYFFSCFLFVTCMLYNIISVVHIHYIGMLITFTQERESSIPA